MVVGTIKEALWGLKRKMAPMVASHRTNGTQKRPP